MARRIRDNTGAIVETTVTESGLTIVNGTITTPTISSPTITGTPVTPTPTAGDNSTKVASTAFVATSFAPLASPALTGNPTAPTQAATDSSTKLATTAFAQGTTPQYVTLTAFNALTPTDGLEVYLIADATNRIIWHLRYDAAASSNKWEFLGGAPMGFYGGTSGNSSVGTYVNFSPDAVITVPLAGNYRVSWGGALAGGNGDSGGLSGFQESIGISIGGAAPTAPSFVASVSLANQTEGFAQSGAAVVKVNIATGLSASTTIRARFANSGNFNLTGTLGHLEVTPVIVGG